MSEDYRLNLLSEELDKYKAVVLKLTEENEQLKALCDAYFTCYRAKHNDIEGNLFSYRKALEEIRDYLQQFKKKKSNFYTLNDAVTDIANNIEKIISEIIGDKNNG